MAHLSRATAHIGSRKPLSLFEKVILVSTLMLLAEAAAGLWITSHSLEAHHYLIDTSFIVGTTVLGLLANLLLLRSSFRPLFSLLGAMRAVGAGETSARAVAIPGDTEIGELALAFNRMLDQVEASRRQQARLVFQAQEEERRRLARELHDESSQAMAALLVHTEVLQQTLQALPESASLPEVRASLAPGLRALTTLAQETLDDVRRLALQLRPAVLDDLGLEAALRWLVEDCRQRLHTAVDLSIDGLEPAALERDDAALYETTLFRIVQECLTNATRHASAQLISVSLQRDRHSLSLCVSDDGKGFETTRPSSGLGLGGMRERVALLGGTLTIASQPGEGTRVSVSLPLAVASRQEARHA